LIVVQDQDSCHCEQRCNVDASAPFWTENSGTFSGERRRSKSAGKGGFRAAPFRLRGARSGLSRFPPAHEAKAGEAKPHHGPCRGFRNARAEAELECIAR
jgi:hypothetical protein